MLAVEPIRLDARDEELRAVCVGAGVGHREDAGLGVLQLEVLVLELCAVDGLAAGAVVVRKVAALAHEVRDHPVEAAALVAEALFASAKHTEVLCRLWCHVAAQLHRKLFDKIVLLLFCFSLKKRRSGIILICK